MKCQCEMFTFKNVKLCQVMGASILPRPVLILSPLKCAQTYHANLEKSSLHCYVA